MKFEIADWRLEVTWSGLVLEPLERERVGATKSAKTMKKTSDQPARRGGASNRHSLGIAAHTFNEHRHQKGATK